MYVCMYLKGKGQKHIKFSYLKLSTCREANITDLKNQYSLYF